MRPWSSRRGRAANGVIRDRRIDYGGPSAPVMSSSAMPGADRQALSFVAACYRIRDDLETWIAGLLETATPLLDRGAGVHAYAYAIGPAGTIVPRSGVVETKGTPTGLACTALPAAMAVPAPLVRSLFCRAPAIVSSWHHTRELDAPAFTDFKPFDLLRTFGVRDIIGASAHDASGVGVLLSVPTATLRPIAPTELRRWRLLRAHLLAGLRLHTTTLRADGDAVLGPSGDVLHAEGAARGGVALESLRRRAQQIDRARSGAARRFDAGTALATWRGLVEGTWSLVDRFDRDGRRYFVAHRNDPRLAAPALLSERERQVAAYAALGYSNKLIAYTLGLAPSTVSSHLRRAMQRLGCETVAELVRVWAPARGTA
ncbi:MAG TPA: LuxR C-terminal-related transcriptional regulator [Nannocystaceae bacterium]|nr:LuxR C-terminal-related transcriptional regulator [Nannocystaceae bacterium]